MAKKVTIDQLREDCDCEHIKYCPLEALLETLGDRFLEQHKLIEYWRFAVLKEDIPFSRAYLKWVDSGLAKRFAEVYSEEKTYKQMRKEMFG